MARVAKENKVVAPVKKVSEAEKIRQMDNAAINEEINKLKQELFNLRLQSAVGKLEHTSELGKVKKQIARMKTVLTERANASK